MSKKTDKKITNLIIIDASSSMSTKAQFVKGSLKESFSGIKKDYMENPKAKVTNIVVQFSYSDKIEVLLNSKKIEKLNDTFADNYEPSGMTALRDAIGFSANLVPKKQDLVLVTIITDGDENASKDFSNEDIQKLVEKKKKKNWIFTFMGTTEDAINAATDMGISRGNTMTYSDTGAGTDFAFKKFQNVRSTMYNRATADGFTLESLDVSNLVDDDELTEDDVEEINTGN